MKKLIIAGAILAAGFVAGAVAACKKFKLAVPDDEDYNDCGYVPDYDSYDDSYAFQDEDSCDYD